MSIRGSAEAILSGQRSTLWSRAYDLGQPESFDAAVAFLTGVLEEYEAMLAKEPGWATREHADVAPERTFAPYVYPGPGHASEYLELYGGMT